MKWTSLAAACLMAATAALLAGCVERTVKVQTDPPGALVTLNDEEVGVSPVKAAFLWYGDYELILRRPGYKTVHTHFVLDAPWYQLPPTDLVAETMVPWTIKDERTLPTYTLQPEEPVQIGELVEHATETRERAVFGGQ